MYIGEAWNAAGDDEKAALQIAFFCCGYLTFGDGPARDPCGTPAPDPAPTDFCAPIMLKSFQDNYHTAGSCGIAFACVMIASLAFTAYLMVGIRESAVNAAIEKNRARNERDMDKRRKKGKGLKIPQIGADVL